MSNIVPESWRDRAFREQERKMPHGNQLREYWRHTTPKLSAPAKRSKNWESWNTELVRRTPSPL